jgi:hypothetical protein
VKRAWEAVVSHLKETMMTINLNTHQSHAQIILIKSNKVRMKKSIISPKISIKMHPLLWSIHLLLHPLQRQTRKIFLRWIATMNPYFRNHKRRRPAALSHSTVPKPSVIIAAQSALRPLAMTMGFKTLTQDSREEIHSIRPYPRQWFWRGESPPMRSIL